MSVSKKSLLGSLCFALASLLGAAVQAEVVFDAIPSPEPYNLASLGYQATSTQEFGDYIQLGGSARALTTIRLGMSNWAVKSNFLDGSDVPLPEFSHVTMDAAGYQHPITLNIYGVDTSGVTPAIGSLIGTKTATASVPWRPENQGAGQPWLAPDNNTYNGIFFTVDFDMTADAITLPDDVIVTVAYNTNTHGYDPIGANGPCSSLNVALASDPAQPTIGVNVDVDSMVWNTSHGPFYADGGAGGVGTLRFDTTWTPYTTALEINAVPEPASVALAGVATLGLIVVRRKASKASKA